MTLFGMVIDVKEEQWEKAHLPIFVTLSGMVTENKEQRENAPSPIIVTPSGMVIEVNEEHS